MTQVTGTLLNPINQLSPKTTIRIVSTGNLGSVVIGSPASVVTGADATYDFPLSNGTYTLEVLYSGSYKLAGEVTITDVTPTPITLPSLFALAI